MDPNIVNTRLQLSPGNLVWIQEEHLQYDLSPQKKVKRRTTPLSHSKVTNSSSFSTSTERSKDEEICNKAALHDAELKMKQMQVNSVNSDSVSKKISTGTANLKKSEKTKFTVEKCQNAFCQKMSSPETQFSRCAGCKSAYCSRQCQLVDWKSTHKKMCSQLSQLKTGIADLNVRKIVGKWLIATRLYLCPFAVHQYKKRGCGFMFVQSENTLLELFYNSPVNSRGFRLNRRFFIHYLTVEEWKKRCVQNFEFSLITSALVKEVSTKDLKVDEKLTIVVLLRCGRLVVVRMPLVPDYRICEKLCSTGGESVESDMLQLNLDE